MFGLGKKKERVPEKPTYPTVVINDVEIELRPCGHCGLVPTEDDAHGALAKFLKNSPVCILCGCTIQLNRASLSHGRDTHADLPSWWTLEFSYKDFEPNLTLERRSGPFSNRDYRVHIACLKQRCPEMLDIDKEDE